MRCCGQLMLSPQCPVHPEVPADPPPGHDDAQHDVNAHCSLTEADQLPVADAEERTNIQRAADADVEHMLAGRGQAAGAIQIRQHNQAREEAREEACEEVNEEVNKELNKELNEEVNKEVNEELNKELNEELNKELNKELNEEVNEEAQHEEVEQHLTSATAPAAHNRQVNAPYTLPSESLAYNTKQGAPSSPSPNLSPQATQVPAVPVLPADSCCR